MINKDKYPLTASYIESLPEGIKSYPDCLSKADSRENIRSEFPQLAEISSLPNPMLDFLKGNHKDPWMSETTSVALQLLVRDAIFKTDQEFLDWCYKEHTLLFKKPHYKIIIHILSPTLLLIGATKKWAAFHKGSTFTSKPQGKQDGKVKFHARLEFPEKLFPPLMHKIQRGAYQAALDAVKAKEPRLEIIDSSDTHASYEITWAR
jgi:hypothetical protein